MPFWSWWDWKEDWERERLVASKGLIGMSGEVRPRGEVCVREARNQRLEGENPWPKRRTCSCSSLSCLGCILGRVLWGGTNFPTPAEFFEEECWRSHRKCCPRAEGHKMATGPAFPSWLQTRSCHSFFVLCTPAPTGGHGSYKKETCRPRLVQSQSLEFSAVQSLSGVQLFATPWTTARQASLSITNSQSPPKPKSIESVTPSNHLILCCPLLLLTSIFPSIRVFPSESFLLTRWPKYLELHLQHQSFQWMFRSDFI